MKDFGIHLGPFQAMDQIGIDVRKFINKTRKFLLEFLDWQVDLVKDL
jgi:3-hydroxyacyl-CoA dehydrogenase